MEFSSDLLPEGLAVIDQRSQVNDLYKAVMILATVNEAQSVQNPAFGQNSLNY